MSCTALLTCSTISPYSFNFQGLKKEWEAMTHCLCSPHHHLISLCKSYYCYSSWKLLQQLDSACPALPSLLGHCSSSAQACVPPAFLPAHTHPAYEHEPELLCGCRQIINYEKIFWKQKQNKTTKHIHKYFIPYSSHPASKMTFI